MKWDDDAGIKEKYVKPTGENKKTILVTDRLANFKKVKLDAGGRKDGGGFQTCFGFLR